MKHFIWCLLLLSACNNGPSPPLSPAEEHDTFALAEGFEIELVASDPLVQDPIVMRFDQDGRLWVVEMRGFMPNIDGEGEDAPVGQVSVLFDNDQDGKMDSATVFVDSLVLPRALAITNGGALVAEDEILWFMEDTDGDLRADKRTVVDPEYGTKGVVEHSANGLWRGLDNWIYNAKSKFRYRQINQEWVREETEFRGQWGICHDNSGNLYYNYNWSQLHADLVPPNYLSRNPHHRPTSGIDLSLSNDRRVFPIRPNLAINRGYVPGTLDSLGKIIEFASACAPFIYRGDILGSEMVNNAFVCEPTGNLVKRNLVNWNGDVPTASNAYSGKEFLASTDERFRPVWLESGPDGALYIVDMYRGVVQHGPYMSPYLREVTLDRQLDKPINLGRIWRVVADNKKTYEPGLKLSTLSLTDLVNLLSHQNGWYRDMAQRILIERADNAAIPLLEELIKIAPNHLARLHALWTLEGLNYQETDLYGLTLADPHADVVSASLRILHQLSQENPAVLEFLEAAVIEDSLQLPELQVALIADQFNNSLKQKVLSDILQNNMASQVFRDAVLSSLTNSEYSFLCHLLDQPDWNNYTTNREITIEQLAAAVVSKGDPEELSQIVHRLDGEKENWRQSALLTGMSFYSNPIADPVSLSRAPGLFTANIAEEQLSSKVSKVAALFDWPGKPVSSRESNNEPTYEIAPEVISRGRSLYLTICASCHGNDGNGMTRFAPPLRNSEWVLGDPERLARILLHGMEGPVEVNGKNYDVPEILPAMPAFATTSPDELAAIMTYIRQEWDHNAEPVAGGMVGRIRVMSQGKITPWTVDELAKEFSGQSEE